MEQEEQKQQQLVNSVDMPHVQQEKDQLEPIGQKENKIEIPSSCSEQQLNENEIKDKNDQLNQEQKIEVQSLEQKGSQNSEQEQSVQIDSKEEQKLHEVNNIAEKGLEDLEKPSNSNDILEKNSKQSKLIEKDTQQVDNLQLQDKQSNLSIDSSQKESKKEKEQERGNEKEGELNNQQEQQQVNDQVSNNQANILQQESKEKDQIQQQNNDQIEECKQSEIDNKIVSQPDGIEIAKNLESQIVPQEKQIVILTEQEEKDILIQEILLLQEQFQNLSNQSQSYEIKNKNLFEEINIYIQNIDSMTSQLNKIDPFIIFIYQKKLRTFKEQKN
ncbi:hypothetical protein ABPG74_001743 [Tetrahymena malaccensis]